MAVRFFCTCHGWRRGTKQDRRNEHNLRATYEARVRVGNQWLNQQQAARRYGR